MSNRKTNDNEICLLCGKWKEEKSLVCQTCFKKWYAHWEKDEETPIIVWVFQKAETCCASIEEKLEQIRNSFDEFSESIKQEAYGNLSKALRGVKVPDFSSMLDDRRQKLWKEREGDKLYGNLKRTETRAQKLPEFVKELKDKIEQFEREQELQEQ